MENNKGNKGTTESRTEEKTVYPSNNSDRDFVNQTGKSQNLGNDSDYLIDPNSKSKPENLVEGSEFLNDSIAQNNAPDEEDDEDSADLDELQVRRNT